jgi:tetratricopeptide (TPR) repeat protein
MPLRRSLFLSVLALFLAGAALAQTDGARELAQGKEAYARRDYPKAAEHFRRAVKALDEGQERARLADAYLQLGMTQLVGLGAPREALTAFLGSTAFSGEPATAFLWAALAAERLGQTADSARYKDLALLPPGEALAEAGPEPEAPAPAAEAKPDAFQHFFGPKGESEKPAAAVEKDGKDKKDEEDKKDAEKVDAFEYFFGNKKKPESEEKPPR